MIKPTRAGNVRPTINFVWPKHVFLKHQPKPGMSPGIDMRTFSTEHSFFLDLAVNHFICLPSLKTEYTALFQNIKYDAMSEPHGR